MSSGFISEAEATEIRKRKQEEWERVRKPTDPIERPEENKSLFERLQEQKQKKELEYEEAHKLKNMIKGLDDDEIEFLDLVDRTKLAADRKKELEEERELNDYRNRVAILQEQTIKERLQAEITVNKPKISSGSKLNQQKLLKGVVVKKSEPAKRKMSATTDEGSESSGDKSNKNNDGERSSKQQKTARNVNEQGDLGGESSAQNGESVQVVNGSAMKCIAILPGLGYYNDSSSDENSSDSDNSEIESKARTDLLGRKLGVQGLKSATEEHKK